MAASHPFEVICSNLIGCLNHFGLDYRGNWKLLMDIGGGQIGNRSTGLHYNSQEEESMRKAGNGLRLKFRWF